MVNYLRVDTGETYTILEISGSQYSDLRSNEGQFTTTFDFPTSQPPQFYKIDINTLSVVPNDEHVIKSYFKESLSGLDMIPHVSNILNGDFTPNSTKEVVIEGNNFTPFSVVEVSGLGNFVNTVYFDSPNKLRIELTVGSTEGLYNLIVYNNDLTSDNSGFNSIKVKAKTIVDLRTINPSFLGLEMTNGIQYEQDTEKGLRFYSNTNSWNRAVLFSSYNWKRSDNITFEIVFTRVSSVIFMLGIGSTLINVDLVSSSYYKQEIGMYHQNNGATSFYGGGNVTNWVQNMGGTVNFEVDKFYKLQMENSGGFNARVSLFEVDPDDWNNSTLLYSFISTCPADDEILTPMIIPQAASGAYYITGFRY